MSDQLAQPFSRVAPSGTSGNVAQGLAALHKAVKGAAFYPQGHPHRTDALQRAFEALQGLLRHRPLIFTVDRRGFAFLGERISGSATILQLANDCVNRRITSITFMQDLLLYDLGALVRLLSSDPHNSELSGPRLEAGARTIWINERDVSAITVKRAASDSDEISGSGAGEKGLPSVKAVDPTAAGLPRPPGVPELLLLMAREGVDARYQELGRELLYALRRDPQLSAILLSLEELHRQHREQQKSLPQREFAIFTFGQLADASADLLLASLESKDCRDKERIHQVLAARGEKAAYSIIERICNAKGLYERKSLAAALVALGPPAMVPLKAALKDKRWYVVRNMVSIIGELRSTDCVSELKRPLYHTDERVRKETIRALVKIGGKSAEAALIQLLEEPDEGLVRRAISSLGQLRSRQAVPVMLKLLERRDLLLKELVVKKELLAALAIIGELSATARLLKMLESRGWLMLGRYLELKVSLATTLGALGDEAARPTLARMAAGSGSLAEACRAALAALESGTKRTD